MARPLDVLACVLVTLVVGTLDYLLGVEISFSIAYFIPVALAAWRLGAGAGVAIAGLSCVSWWLNDSVLNAHAYSHPLIPWWNAIMRGMVFAIMALLTARVARALRNEHEASVQITAAHERLDQTRMEQLVLKDRLLSHVSHELRTPLTALHQFLTILRDRIAGPLTSEQAEYLDIALRNADQLKRMIGDLLDSTRAETGKLSVELVPLDLVSVLQDVARTLRSPAAEGNLQVVVSLAEGLPPVLADPTRVRQVLINLLDNAVKFTPGPGRITLSARSSADEPGFARIAVADTGRGMGPEALQKVFSRLYQEEGATTSSRRGLGLGLHICRELVTRQGGRIWVESVLAGGTTVTFTLPLAEPGPR